MATRRGRSQQRLDKSDDGKQTASRGSTQSAYRRLVRSSSNTFRSSIEFREKPRQIAFGAALLVILGGLAYFNSSNASNPVEAVRGAVTAGMIALVGYAMLQSKDGLMVCTNNFAIFRLTISFVHTPCYGEPSMAWDSFISAC